MTKAAPSGWVDVDLEKPLASILEVSGLRDGELADALGIPASSVSKRTKHPTRGQAGVGVIKLNHDAQLAGCEISVRVRKRKTA